MLFSALHHPLFCKNIHGAFLNKIEGPDIIQSRNMITVFMGEKNCIQSVSPWPGASVA